MSTAEYLEILAMSQGLVATHSMNAVSILFAYLVAAYVVGRKFSRFQVISISLIYTVFLTLPVFAMLGEMSSLISLNVNFAREYPDFVNTLNSGRISAPGGYFLYVNAFVWLSGWLLSLYFMYNARKEER